MTSRDQGLAAPRRLTADAIASSTAPCRLGAALIVGPAVVANEGYCVAVRVLADKAVYNRLECDDGSLHTLRAGDLIAGTLGQRRALRGYSGRLPERLRPGQRLQVLNMGGIIGECTSEHPDLGPALDVTLLGAVMASTAAGELRPARIQDHAVPPAASLSQSAPLVMVSGTCMNTGKTRAAARIVQGLARRGLRVAAAKLTGAALLRDVDALRRHGAVACMTFGDAGLVSTVGADVVPAALGLVSRLHRARPDAIVLELGDGFIGHYGVDELLRDGELRRHTAAHVVTATDLAGAWAADRTFRERYAASITVMTGPVTDNVVGCEYIRERLGVPAWNARTAGEELVAEVHRAVCRARATPPLQAPLRAGRRGGSG